MHMKRGDHPLRIFWKIICKSDTTIDPKTKITVTKVEKFKHSIPTQKFLSIKSDSTKIKINRSWIYSFPNPIKINKKNVQNID